MQSIVRRLTAFFFLSGQWGEVDFCGLFRPQRRTCLTFAASDPKNNLIT